MSVSYMLRRIFHLNKYIAMSAFILNKSNSKCESTCKINNSITIKKEYYSLRNNIVSCISHYKNNKLHGKRTVFHMNGKICSECNFKDGKINGLSTNYFPNGNKRCENTFVNNCVNGLSTWWYENGNIKMKFSYISGKPSGVYTEWNENGKLHVCRYNDSSNNLHLIALNNNEGKNCILDTGDIHVWKACLTDCKTEVYVKIFVPKEAKRVTPYSCQYSSRIEYGIVEQIIDKNGNEYNSANSFVHKTNTLTYEKGKKVCADNINMSTSDECGNGINVQKYKKDCDYWFDNFNNKLFDSTI